MSEQPDGGASPSEQNLAAAGKALSDPTTEVSERIARLTAAGIKIGRPKWKAMIVVGTQPDSEAVPPVPPPPATPTGSQDSTAEESPDGDVLK
jgi:hypothetical protein